MKAGSHSVSALSLAGLQALPKGVSRPTYSRAALSAGIVHFGPGNFHRAHQGVFLDALMNTGRALDWAVIGASVMPGDEGLRQTLLAQDLLTTVVSQSAVHSEARVTGPMVDYLPVADTEAILATLVDPRIRIVSLTVTEGGYFIDADTGRFDVSHELIQHDLANPDSPRTVFGLIVKALAKRELGGLRGFTVLSCDNLPHNGSVARAAVLGMAERIAPALLDWIKANVSFPCGMVDRIAPATGPRERELIQSTFGVADQAPVFCEDYLQWVLEDKFVAGRPALESVGVQFVDDVAPYETMKIRILNGGHALIAYAAALLDIEFGSEAIAHPWVGAFMAKVEREEILPVVPAVPGVELPSYLTLIQTRFANPKIGDTVRRLCFDGSNRQPKFIVPTIRDQIAAGGSLNGLALACALWCRYCYGQTDSGVTIEANDPSWPHLKAMAAQARENPGLWLGMREVYGDLGDDQRFSERFDHWLRTVWQLGTAQALRQYLQNQVGDW